MMSGGLVDLTSGYDPETDEWYQDPGVLAEGSRKLVDSRSGVKEYDPTTPYEKWLKTDYTPSEVSYKANPDQTSGAQRPSPSR